MGVQGDKQRKGELFGIQNMFTLRTGERCLTEDILKVSRIPHNPFSFTWQFLSENERSNFVHFKIALLSCKFV